jgi:ferredoxin
VHVSVDLDLCQGYANCVTTAPEVFSLDDASGLAVVVLSEPPPELERAVRDAVRLCPMQAISAHDEPAAG